MVVDDSADMRLLVRAYVEREDSGVAVVAEADGLEQALAVLDESAPDVAIVDAHMPVADGYETARAVRARRPGLPVLLLTAVVDDDVRDRAAEVGIEACLDKGEFGRLAEVVRELAARP